MVGGRERARLQAGITHTGRPLETMKIIIITSVTNPKILITDPDPQIENHAFWIPIRILD